MRSLFIIPLVILCLGSLSVRAQSGDNAISDEEILQLYEGLRVADVADGLDMVGLQDVTIMHQKIEALWKDIGEMSHIMCGIALTARFVPTNRVVESPKSREDFVEWEAKWYEEISSEPFLPLIKEGSVIVLDVNGDGDVGSVGSNNALGWVSRGARGVVSNGGIRDTDEIILQKIPVYLDIMNRGRGIRPGRNEIESVNQPVSVGGVLVRPGDVVVADGDGVVIVPREHARIVAEYALAILNNDKAGRKILYEELGIPLDKTVEQ
jgi:4-hydroxy-4-methyl-2-oxoglutarate aldolase